MARKALLGRVSDVDIRLLRVFRSVVACGGLSAAELELNIGRSTISRHLTDLEMRLGVKLCDRGPAGFALTSEGERVLDASARLLSAINNFQSDIDEVHLRLTGHLSIALFDKTVTNPDARLPETIRSFDEIAPKATIEIHVEPFNAIESGVLSGRFHLAIIPPHRQSSSLNYYPVYSEEMYLYCGANHPLFGRADSEISRQDVRQHKYAGIGFHSPNMEVSHRLNLKRSADAYDEEALAVLILSGCYLGFLPDHYAKRFVDSGSMRCLRPEEYHYRSSHSVVVRRSPQPSRLVQEFLDCLRRIHSPESKLVHKRA
ncbi:LysR family transcriptional regulator [Pelagibius sp. Alg239-R121]|uniref:LysR family transcriptional regulator n=1 Tax=Pelagibius sp. Alg239-R121 TaxID=2993448 RepID=UPI0024A698AD|nr:LysR family transcriptional regulator [Pelagibius sp. Alg239-R121]